MIPSGRCYNENMCPIIFDDRNFFGYAFHSAYGLGHRFAAFIGINHRSRLLLSDLIGIFHPDRTPGEETMAYGFEAANYITGAVLYVDGGDVAEGTPRVMDGSGVP